MLPMPLVSAISLPFASARPAGAPTWRADRARSRWRSSCRPSRGRRRRSRPAPAARCRRWRSAGRAASIRSPKPRDRLEVGQLERLDADVRARPARALDCRAVATTFQPSAAYWRANSRPMPRLAPVIRTVGMTRERGGCEKAQSCARNLRRPGSGATHRARRRPPSCRGRAGCRRCRRRASR